MLYLISTPIGNFGDISFRALETLKDLDVLYAEDTRRTKHLLDHFSIQKKLRSFHSFNEKEREEEIIQYLKQDLKVGVVSDAGMPTISDPGARLVHRMQKEHLSYSVIPGASALTAAIALSGSLSPRMQFLGFIPKKPGEAKKILQEALDYPGLSIFYETPQRLLKTLSFLSEDTEVIIAREISKLHEEILRQSAKEVIEHFSSHPLKGEIVLMLEGEKRSRPTFTFNDALKLLSPHVSKTKAEKLAKKISGES